MQWILTRLNACSNQNRHDDLGYIHDPSKKTKTVIETLGIQGKKVSISSPVVRAEERRDLPACFVSASASAAGRF